MLLYLLIKKIENDKHEKNTDFICLNVCISKL